MPGKLISLSVVCFLLLGSSSILPRENPIMGKLQFEADSKVVKTSGVWIDGQYVGYLHELKGSDYRGPAWVQRVQNQHQSAA